MKLPIPFFNNKKDDKGYYLALILDDEKAGSVILEEDAGKLKIVGKHTEHFQSPLETIPHDELVKIIDRTISKAEEVLPPNIETHKTIFGVKEEWVDEESKKIKKEYLAKLKKVCDVLDLSPIGFMVVTEAIAGLIQHEEGSPLSAILAEVGKKEISIKLFRGGKVSESTMGPINHSIPVVIDTLLKNFTAPVLPTRLILLHTKSSEELSQYLINHEWSKSLPFLHVPQVSVLPSDYESKAVSYGAASQMGFEIIGLSDKADSAENVEKQEEKNHDKDDSPSLSSTKDEENFGFAINQDIAKEPKKEAAEKSLHDEKSENFDEIDEEESPHINLKVRHPETNHEETESDQYKAKEKVNVFGGVLNFLSNIKFPKMNRVTEFFAKNKGLKLPLLILGSVIVFLIAISLFYFYGVKAQIILSVKPNEVKQVENITFSASADNDFSKNIIAAESISTSIEGKLSTPATGKKDTGDKAKGNVTIYNSDNSPANLSSGTEIKSSNGLTFTLDKDIKLASASGDIFTGTKPGTATVAVSAKDIGTESNLPSNTKFSIGSNSSFAAKNDSAFSGGTKKIITVVSKNDIAKLRADLPKNLEKNAVSKFSESKDPDNIVLPGFVNIEITDEEFDKKVDQEAKEVTLTATVKFNGMSYQREDLENFDKSILKDKYSQDISFATNSLENKIKSTKMKTNNEISASLEISAGLLPKINNDEVISKIKNKSPRDINEVLGTLPQVAGSEIKFSPNIFFLSHLFPRLPNDISVLVKSDE